MTVNKPPRDAPALLAAFVAGAAEIRREKALTHRELARAGHEAALTYNGLANVLERVASKREVEKLDMEAVLSYIAAGMELISQTGPLETLDKGKLAQLGARVKSIRRGGRVSGDTAAAGKQAGGGAERSTEGASKQAKLRDAGSGETTERGGETTERGGETTERGGETIEQGGERTEGSEEKKPAFRGQIGNTISTLWGTANQMVPLPEGEDEAVQQIKEGVGGAEKAAQSAFTSSEDIDDETHTEESMGGMLRKLMKGGQSV